MENNIKNYKKDPLTVDEVISLNKFILNQLKELKDIDEDSLNKEEFQKTLSNSIDILIDTQLETLKIL
ncbi:hypothetical protein Q7177_002708, partial [Enterococcus faecium]|nr:hypothetical protein [Enterococcus faecium]